MRANMYLTKNTIPFSTNNLFDTSKHLGLNWIENIVFPFAYDGQAWIDAYKKMPNLQKGWLNNPSVGWASLLYSIREHPILFYQSVNGKRVDSISFENIKYKINQKLENLQLKIERDARLRFTESEMRSLGSDFYLLTQCTTGKKPLFGSRFSVDFQFEKEAIIQVALRDLAEVSETLTGKAWFSEVDPSNLFFRVASNEETHLISPSCLWCVLPGSEHEESSIMFIDDFLTQIAKRNGAFVFSLPKKHEAILIARYAINPSAGRRSGKYSSRILQETSTHWIVGNV